MKRLKSELKNEEMALVLLKKLKQSQQLPAAREVTAASTTSLGGGATLTATRLTSGGGKAEAKTLQRQTSATNDLLNTDKLVSIPVVAIFACFIISNSVLGSILIESRSDQKS